MAGPGRVGCCWEREAAHYPTMGRTDMASAGDGEDTAVVLLEITDTSSSPPPPVSVSDIAPLPSPSVAVCVDRHRLIESSSYFRALLGGSFSESGRQHVRVCCNLEPAVQVLRYLFQPSGSFAISHDNFIPLLEGALFLVVDNLLMECERWFSTISSQTSSQLVPLDFITEVWYFAQEHGVAFVQDMCPGYLAQNFAEVISMRSFNKIPYGLLSSTIECPHLTVDSEKQLCEALLSWVSENMKPCEQPNQNIVDDQLCLLSKVKISLLPMEFAAGTKIHWLGFGNNIVCTILNLLKNSMQILLDAVAGGTVERYHIRITQYSKKIVLSGCPQITTAFLYMSVLPTDMDAAFKRRIVCSYTHIDHHSFILYDELQTVANTMSFRNVHMVDLSKCPKIHFGAAIDWLNLSFPELKTFRASYCLSFQFNDLQYLLRSCPRLNEIDLTIDTSTVMPRHSVISSSSEVLGKGKPNPRRYYRQYQSYGRQPDSIFSNISRLTLEGRDDIDDMDFLEISVLEKSLYYINIRNCTMLTDDGISNFLLKCRKIHSMVLSYTSFGDRSIQTICTPLPSDSTDHNYEYARVMAFNMQELHLDGCKGIGCASLSQLISNINIVKFLCLRETSLTDGALCKFVGSCLEFLDVSETADVEMGWGFCPILVEELIPSFSNVRRMTIGLGTTLAESVLHALPGICPFIESLVLRFQVISDRVVRNLLESATNLQVLCLHYCLGSLSSYSFQAKAPALRILRLEWVTPWITNDDLTILAQNCSLVELSLSGCKLLDSSSQDIISSGWPNLILLHLEECGQITLDGVSSIFNCKALEDVVLRHTGRGIGRAVANDAVRELPLLRKLALDVCDACEGGYDIPNNLEGGMIRTVRMSRCKSWRSCFEGSSKPVHKDTIVLEWSSRRLTTTIVKEKL